MTPKEFAADYVNVADRIAIFRDKYPEGSLQPFDPADPLKVIEIGGSTFLLYTACAYRTADDRRPGIGIAWEPFPGKTPFTRDSEAMVAETSAWGRAIVAVLAADTKKGVASADEVRNRQTRPTAAELVTDTPPDWDAVAEQTEFEQLIDGASTATELNELALRIANSRVSGAGRETLRQLFSAKATKVGKP